MPDLNPLKFQVAIQDDATGQLNKIEQEFDKLKDKTISVKVNGLEDLQQLLSALQHQQVQDIGKNVGSAINDATKNLQKEAQDAIRTSLGNLAKDLVSVKEAIKSDSFSTFSQRIETCAEKITLLDEAFKKFKVTIGENKELKDLLTGWGAAIKEVSAAMAAMNSVKNGGGAKAAQKEDLKQQEEGLIRVANAMGRVRDAASGSGGASLGGVAFMESINKVGERNIQTLIKEQGHIERLIAIAKKSIDFGEGHPVLGMGRLRGDQMQNLQNLEQLKKIINEILFAANQGDQAAIRFLNTLGSLKTTPFGKDSMGNDVTLLGGHFDKLTHSVTGTASAMRTLNKEMRLDSNVWPNSEQDSNLRRYNQLLADAEKLLRRIDEAGAKGSKLGLDASLSNIGVRDVSNFIEKALKFNDVGNFRALNELIAQFQRLKNVYGDVAREQERMNSNTIKSGERADAQYMKEVEQFTKQAINEYNQWQESIRRAGVEITNLKIKLKELEDVEKRGKAAGSDTTNLQARISALRQELSVLQEIHNGSKSYGFAKDYVKTEKFHETLKLAEEEGKAVKKNAQERERADSKAIKDLETIETNQRRYNQLLTDASNLQDRLSTASTKGNGLLLDTTKTETALQQLQQHIDKVLNFDSRNLRDNHAVNELIASWNALKNTLTGVAKEQEKLNTATERANKKAQENSTKQAQKENEQWAESMRRAGVEATKLEIQVRKLQEAESKGQKAGINTAQLSARIAELQNYITILRSIEGGSKVHGHTSDFVNSASVQNAIRLANEEAGAVRRATTEKERASKATQQLSADEQRLAQALNQTTESARGQSQVLSDLKSLATQYLGVWGAQGFLRNIIEIGGQLEMQRLSIGAILQNQAQANDLFNKIKGLATQSPFGVVELDQMTKQLTAYGFKYNELFDMTKRLADISAATGTGVDRLALALGHVRSEAALSGYTLRQFAMGNVPMLQKLSEKLGKSTEEIRKMVRAKQISYDDVVGVLKDLTDEGGMFHNMQEVISQSVKAKFKNVKDAMDIMYGEMAEGSVGDALKEVADVLMDVTRNWKDAATVISTGTAMWALHRVAVIANIAVLGEHNAATLKNIAAFRAQEVQQLRTASMYRVLTAAEQQQIAISKQLTAGERLRLALGQSLSASRMRDLALGRQQQVMDLALALSSKKLTTEAIARQVALGKLSKAQARQILSLADLTAAERSAGIAAVNNTTRFGYMRMAFITAGDAALRLGRTLKALMFNPATLMMGGITAVIELWQRNSREIEAAEELSNKIYEHSQEALKNTRQMMQDTGIKVMWRDSPTGLGSFSDVTGNFGQQLGGQMYFEMPEFDTSNAEESIKRWTQYIRDYAATPNRLLNEALFDEAGNVRALKDQFDNLKVAVKEVAVAQEKLRTLGDIFENAVNATNAGWFDDSVLTNILDYDKTLKSFGNNIATTYKKFRVNIDIALQSARQQDAEFDKAASGMATYAQQLDLLMRNQEKYAKASEIFRNANSISRAAMNELSGDHVVGDAGAANVEAQKATMMADLETFYVQLQADLETNGIKIGSMSEAQQQALLLGYKDKLSSIQGLSEETANFLMKEFAKRFGIEIDVDDEKFMVKESEIKRLLKELSESDWNVEMNFATNIKDVIDEARKQYKAAKEYFEKVKPIMLKLGVEFEMGKVLTDEQIEAAIAKADPKAREFVRQALQGVNEATRVYNNAMNASKAGGFSLEDEKKKKTGGGSKAYKDEFAKRWDERIRIMKEAYGWYDKWEKKVGNDAAIAETNSKYEDIFKEWRTDKVLPMDFDVNKIADYQKYVEKIRDDALKRYQSQKNDKSKKNGEEALRVYRQAVALLNDIKFDNFIKAAEQFKAIIDQTIEDLNTRWDIYNTVRSATGNESLALDVAGISDSERNVRNSADALKEELKRQFSSLGGMAPLLEIDFDAQKDAESVRKMFENLVPADARDKIDGLIEGFKEWQKLQNQVVKSDISSYTKLLGLVTDYDAQVQKINDRLKQQKDANANLVNTGKITSEQGAEADNIAETQADWEKMQLSAQYANLYNNAIAMSRTEFEQATTAVEKMIARLKELGLITPEQALQEQQKLDKAKTEYSTAGFLGEKGAVGQFISGGYEGLMGYYAKRRDKAQEKANKSEKGSQEQKDAQKEADHYGKLFTKFSELSDAAKDVITAFSTLQSGLDLVSNLFNSIGNEGAANVVGDASNILGGAMQGAQSLSMLGPWGMAAGAGLGLISGIAQVHDNQLAREIEALRLDVEKIESNTALILANRERTFGYDKGQLRTSYAQKDYSNQAYITIFGKRVNADDASYDMFNYYMENANGNGYQQQYTNLKKEREDQLQILRDQEDMKDRSESDIQETIAKISELDEQIRYFGIDLAKELWDIDVKGWADQIGDALMTAFEDGEDAAKAYEDTIRNIMQSVSSNILKIGILEPMMERLNNKLFGYIDAEGKEHAGVVTTEDITSNPEKAAERLILATNEYFAKEGKAMITAAREFYVGLNDALEKGGLAGGLYNQETGNTLSSSMQGTTEETSDLMAAYLNAARQDLSVNRLLLTQFISEMWPSYIEQISSAVSSLNGINNNVAFIRELLSENGALYMMLDSMRSHLDNITNGNEQISVK